MKWIWILFIILLVNLFAFTTKHHSTDNYYSKYMTQDSIFAHIDFMPLEVSRGYHEQGVRSLKLRFVTKGSYPCCNYTIGLTRTIKGSELIVQFEEIIKPSICLTSFGPASSTIDLSKNINKLTFINGHNIDIYELEITEERISISPIQSGFTTPRHNNTFRYPKNTFAYTCGTNTEDVYIYDVFSKILLDNPLFTEYKFNGKGKIPYPLMSAGHWRNHPSRFFKYQNDVDFDVAEELLRGFTSEHIKPNAGNTITLRSWDNRNVYSYKLK